MRRASFWRRVMRCLGTYGSTAAMVRDAAANVSAWRALSPDERARAVELLDAPADDVPAQH